MREQTLLTEVLGEVRKRLPFALLGFDTDNDSVFMNETVRDYCEEAGVEFTRCRPYRKNDQAWVEQKNGAVVRRIVGYRRYAGLEAAATLGRLYLSVRLFVNFFQPSFKLAEKVRNGAKVTKHYHPPATPYQRLLEDPRTSDLGSCPAVERDSSGAVPARPNCRSASDERSRGSKRAYAGAISSRATNVMAGRRGTSDQQAEKEGHSILAPVPGPVRNGSGADARLV